MVLQSVGVVQCVSVKKRLIINIVQGLVESEKKISIEVYELLNGKLCSVCKFTGFSKINKW